MQGIGRVPGTTGRIRGGPGGVLGDPGGFCESLGRVLGGLGAILERPSEEADFGVIIDSNLMARRVQKEGMWEGRLEPQKIPKRAQIDME